MSSAQRRIVTRRSEPRRLSVEHRRQAHNELHTPLVRLDRAMLCLDCESIFEASGPPKCPACGSHVAWAMGRALNPALSRE